MDTLFADIQPMNAHPEQLDVLKLRRLPLTKIVTRDADGVLIKRSTEPPYAETELLDPEAVEYTHYPALVLPDGSPWVHGNLYMLSKIIATYHQTLADQQTLMTIARELKLFMAELHKEGLNYLEFPTRKLQRPTYFYAARLKKRVDAGEIEESTRNKKLGCVFGFYSWLKNQHDFVPTHSMWDETVRTITYLDEKGFAHQKVVKKNSLRPSRATPSKTAMEGFINDGGILRPYNRREQDILIKSLEKTDNIELKLICIIALTTGARVQTVLTMRKSHIVTIAKEEGSRKFSLKVGRGTGADTKKSKPHILRIPEWLHYRLATYVASPRFKAREAKASDGTKANGYIFITEDGLPFYSAKNDKATADYRNIPRGDALRQTVRRSLQPLIDASAMPFKFHFHDLRATFGMNLTEDMWARMDKNEMSFMQVVNAVKERLGHTKLETTMQYLNYRADLHGLQAGYDAIESQLMAIAKHG